MTFTVRLVGGNSSHEGRLEVYHNGVWASVCDHGFTDTEASVACRSLGFTCVSHWLVRITYCLL